MENVINIRQDINCATDFERIMNPHLGHLYRVALRFSGGCVADSEDLIQDLLVKLYSKRKQLAEIERLRPWLVKVLYRSFIDHVRRQNRSPLHLVTKPKDDGIDIIDNLASSTAGPDEEVTRQERNKQLLAAVQSLNEEQRTVCILHDMEGYTLVELEEILDIPLGTLKSRLHRARRRLRKILGTMH